jgi:peptidoglycan hydrolase CwlO-like protein
MTNKNNTLLAAAKADLARAQKAEAAVEPIHDKAHDDERAIAHAKVEDAAKVLAAVQEERKRLRDLEGGGATGAGTRM